MTYPVDIRGDWRGGQPRCSVMLEPRTVAALISSPMAGGGNVAPEAIGAPLQLFVQLGAIP
ncbi:hypothetical protein C9413_18320 [Rhizobium sp. SEMIA 4085]|uniref:Uncharacterized protein n=1 Tax=Rhizobium gallicum bv. gallicum R602sp TaxID=1041138 RepID=A0A0B4X456_9HYPH|nr:MULTISPECIES: hypothetical protein [Rhizobium]AJD41293.1 hypothetical protein RGR602_CH01963 [Rhizobium gallicum bv. gallicum R602sp]NNH31382.1 hypothetical protein [Rhizobium sp. SEMIA 4085]